MTMKIYILVAVLILVVIAGIVIDFRKDDKPSYVPEGLEILE